MIKFCIDRYVQFLQSSWLTGFPFFSVTVWALRLFPWPRSGRIVPLTSRFLPGGFHKQHTESVCFGGKQKFPIRVEELRNPTEEMRDRQLDLLPEMWLGWGATGMRQAVDSADTGPCRCTRVCEEVCEAGVEGRCPSRQHRCWGWRTRSTLFSFFNYIFYSPSVFLLLFVCFIGV